MERWYILVCISVFLAHVGSDFRPQFDLIWIGRIMYMYGAPKRNSNLGRLHGRCASLAKSATSLSKSGSLPISLDGFGIADRCLCVRRRKTRAIHTCIYYSAYFPSRSSFCWRTRYDLCWSRSHGSHNKTCLGAYWLEVSTLADIAKYTCLLTVRGD